MWGLLGLVLISGCVDGSGSQASTERVGRLDVERQWSLAFAIGGSADTTFLDPLFVEVRGDQVAVWDDGRRALLLFDTEGQLLWQFGREGAGPGEFARVRDIAFGPDGDIHVLDAGNGRLTRIADGAAVDRIALGPSIGMPDQVIVGDRAIRLMTYGSTPLVTIDAGGDLVTRAALPHVSSDVDPMASQAVMAGTPDGWALALMFGGGWIGFPRGGEGTSYHRQLVNDPGFPDVERSGTGTRLLAPGPIVSAISVEGGTVFVQRYDRAEETGFLDRFSLEDGAYQGSWRLPPEASKAYDSSVSDSFIALLKADPSPTLLVNRPGFVGGFIL